jgi:hypothetical protein
MGVEGGRLGDVLPSYILHIEEQANGQREEQTIERKGDRKGLHPSQPFPRLYYDYEVAPQARSSASELFIFYPVP